MPEQQFTLRGDYVTLGQLLKLAGIIGSGGEARGYLAEQSVLVNGEVEQRRGRKLRHGDTVAAPGEPTITVIDDDAALLLETSGSAADLKDADH